MAKRAGILSRRYAKALLNVVGVSTTQSDGRSDAQALAAELGAFAKELFDSLDARTALLSPMFKPEERKAALVALAKHSNISESGVKFLTLIAERERLNHLQEIVQAFAVLADQAAQVVRVEVVTANEISQSESAEIEKGLTRMITGNPKFQWRVDRALIGGMLVRYEGKILDGSIQGKLERLEQELLR